MYAATTLKNGTDMSNAIKGMNVPEMLPQKDIPDTSTAAQKSI